MQKYPTWLYIEIGINFFITLNMIWGGGM